MKKSTFQAQILSSSDTEESDLQQEVFTGADDHIWEI